ncbi:MAG: hypothetical protein IKS32_14095 [Solobacterium sp.]|nr:hypothetical protein [Solobacterium sp.]
MMDPKNKINDEKILEISGGKWTLETLTPEEQDEFMKVSEELNWGWNYVAYNDFIERMNKKYGA